MKTISNQEVKEMTATRVTNDVVSVFAQYGTDKGVSQYVVANITTMISKRAWTSIQKDMPWVTSPVEFGRVVNAIEASVVATVVGASATHDVSANAIEFDAVMAIEVDSWKRVIVAHRVANGSKSEKAVRKQFDKEIGAQPAHGIAAFVFNQYMGVTGFEKSAISESTIKKVVSAVTTYMIDRGIIMVSDTNGKKNGGIKAAHTINPEIMDAAIKASMDVRQDAMQTMVSIGAKFPKVTFSQATSPKVSIMGKEVIVHDPIATVNTPESMATVMTMIDKSNAVGFVIDRDHIELMASIPEDVWAV